jgi:uncharacterized protein
MAVQKKIPMRKCIVTNEMRPKKELIRIVRNKEGEIFVDDTGKKNGRGAYLSKDLDVIQKAKEKDILSNHFHTKVDSSIYEELMRFVKADKK